MSDTRRRHGPDYVARFTARHAGESRRLRGILAHIALSPSDRVLDVGCGDGALLPWVRDRVASYVGVDFSVAFLRLAHHRGTRKAAFVCGGPDAVRGPFTVAFALDVSEHIPDADWLAVLREIHRVLVPGGRLYLHTPNAAFLLERLKACGILRQFPEHVAVRTAAENMALLRATGFAVTAAVILPHYNVLRVVHPLRHLPVIGQHFEARLLIAARRS